MGTTTSPRTLDERERFGSGPLSSRYDAALAYAAAHHRGQERKGSVVPYLSHLMSVSALVLEHGGDEDTAIAALLHDAVEDAGTKGGPTVLREITEHFGQAVAGLVRECSDGLDEDGNRSGSWSERKTPYLAALEYKSLEAMLITAADKTHNARCLGADTRTFGPTFLESGFRSCPHQAVWYYETVRDSVERRLDNPPAVAALGRAVAEFIAASGLAQPTAGGSPEPCDCAPRPSD